jgi:hypothetical protein
LMVSQIYSAISTRSMVKNKNKNSSKFNANNLLSYRMPAVLHLYMSRAQNISTIHIYQQLQSITLSISSSRTHPLTLHKLVTFDVCYMVCGTQYLHCEVFRNDGEEDGNSFEEKYPPLHRCLGKKLHCIIGIIVKPSRRPNDGVRKPRLAKLGKI